MGYQVVLVGNGREAVEECENNHFDLILMDILMPVMDGFEAVRLIREQERFQGRHTPIVALTSYLLKAVQERCATVGMDGYLSKPVTQSKLEDLINSFFAPQAAPPFSIFSSDDATTTSPAPVLNLQESITNLGSDVNFYREMLELFTTLGYQLLDEIIQRLQSESETDGLDRLAHKLKGMSANVGAAQLAEICRRMQESEEQFSNPAVCSAYLQELQDAQTALHATLKELDWQKAKEQYLSDKP
jgi:CheY-like chemotaxis protein